LELRRSVRVPCTADDMFDHGVVKAVDVVTPSMTDACICRAEARWPVIVEPPPGSARAGP
jgi:hypothetical protein